MITIPHRSHHIHDRARPALLLPAAIVFGALGIVVVSEEGIVRRLAIAVALLVITFMVGTFLVRVDRLHAEIAKLRYEMTIYKSTSLDVEWRSLDEQGD